MRVNLNRNLLGTSLSRALYKSAAQDVNRLSLHRAKFKLYGAVAIEKLLQLYYAFFFRFDTNTSLYNQVPLLYAKYKYEIYFGSFVQAAEIRKSIVFACTSWLENIEKPTRIHAFVVCAAMETMRFEKIVTILDISAQEMRLVSDIEEIQKFMHAVKGLACRKNNWANIVGPNYSWSSDASCIKASEINICLNKPIDYRLGDADERVACNVVYVNGQFLLKRKFLPTTSSTSYATIKCRKEDYDSVHTLVNEGENILFESYVRPNKFFINGYANMAQAAAFDLVMSGMKVKLIGVDLFTLPDLYRADHHTRDKSKMEMNCVVRTHDLLSNFAFLKMLYREGVLVAQGSVTILNDLSLEEYAQKIQENFGNLRTGILS